jgi:DNA recombination protein RmuC
MNEVLLYAAIALGVLQTAILLVLLLKRQERPPDPTPALLALEKATERAERGFREELGRNREESSSGARQLREETQKAVQTLGDSVLQRMAEHGQLQKGQLESFAAQMAALTQTVEAKLKLIQEESSQKLEQMRATVDEKLHATLERRLGESFKIVSERLELVHKGLGEMQNLASGVGDLKKVLTNIKTRGSWGEIQLGNLLEQTLTADQYSANVAPNPQSGERVEFAIKLPGKDANGTVLWLPIDAKFPQEDYQRLGDAQEAGDLAGVEAAQKALETRIRLEARKIREKYVCPPHTTDFAILFLPTEGLFAEVLRQPGLYDGILREHRVVITGPTTLSAVLSSLQMGFRTLAIEKRSSDVWNVLGAVKTEFSKFGEVLGKVKKKLEEASNHIDNAAVRSRQLERSLREVEAVPADQAKRVLDGVEGPIITPLEIPGPALGPLN